MVTGYSHMRCGLLGEHLGHSFSPLIHSLLTDYSYDLIEKAPNEVESFVKGREYNAYNVTIPYKKTVIPFLDVISPEAQKLGAVNTVVNKNGTLYGYNTDYFGFSHMIDISGIDIREKKSSGAWYRWLGCNDMCSAQGQRCRKARKHLPSRQ